MDDAVDLRLRQAGLKATEPRRSVLAQLLDPAQNGQHISAEALYRQLLQAGRHQGLATVYRVLAQLEAAGLVRRRQFDGGKAVYELADDQPHLHLVSRDQGGVVELHDQLLQQRLAELAAERGLRIVDQQLVVYVQPLPRQADTGPAR